MKTRCSSSRVSGNGKPPHGCCGTAPEGTSAKHNAKQLKNNPDAKQNDPALRDDASVAGAWCSSFASHLVSFALLSFPQENRRQWAGEEEKVGCIPSTPW